MGAPGNGKERYEKGYIASTIVDKSGTSQYQRDLIDKGAEKVFAKSSNDAAGAYAQRETAKIIAINSKAGLIPGNPVRAAGNSTAKIHPDNVPAKGNK